MFNLSGKRALITGSSQGIGFALARGLASAGAEIILNGRDQAKLATAAQELGGEGATVQSLAFDATDHAAVRRAVDGFEAEVGAIDILINNAGMQHRTALQDFPADAFERLLQTNIASVFHVGQAVLVCNRRSKASAGKSCCRPISRRFFMWAKRLPVI